MYTSCTFVYADIHEHITSDPPPTPSLPPSPPLSPPLNIPMNDNYCRRDLRCMSVGTVTCINNNRTAYLIFVCMQCTNSLPSFINLDDLRS